MSTTAERVARGAAWLDEKYPGWFNKIDLSILDLADCTQCVLGQVYTGVIPDAERGQLLAQTIASVTAGYPDSEDWAREYREEVESGSMGGFQVLTDFHQLPEEGEWHGFVARFDGRDEDLEKAEYQMLLEEWTRMIVRRRTAFYQNIGDAELRELASIV